MIAGAGMNLVLLLLPFAAALLGVVWTLVRWRQGESLVPPAVVVVVSVAQSVATLRTTDEIWFGWGFWALCVLGVATWWLVGRVAGWRRWVGLGAMGFALAFAVATVPVMDYRWNDSAPGGGCEAAGPTALDGDRVEFAAHCRFWVHRVGIRAPGGVAAGSDNLGTEPDFLVALGGPVCRIRDGLTCDGEIDAGETFTGWIEPAGDPCDGPVKLRVDGGACSDDAHFCALIGYFGEVRFDPPPQCG
jgi:hypothetical protein